ncbi:hypothetical protein VB796_22325 [Arcicella sp. LKC2W]|uniref:hypothetical protein n=1 Tax=Arcicella sp. LKC2W TaxID=2984198 RepID=UPI002B1F3062|nr:hypothetical protein [Arcicella sp. LKC2W]MEA5461823.1 hypothetical protein [Arcicella sp. LKC2W]
MKKILLLLLVSFNLFAQNPQSNPKRSFSITSFYHKNIVFNDTVFYDVEYIDAPKIANPATIRRMTTRVSFADAFPKNNKYTYDSIPEIASINVNGISFDNKKILNKIPNYEILLIKTDSARSFRYNPETKEYFGTARYKKPHSVIYQDHANIPRDFYFFKEYTLEPIRYKCSSDSPVLDVFRTEDTIIVSTKPRVMIDGRLQPKSYDYQHIDVAKVKQIEVFGKEDALKFFGHKAKSGLIAVTTKDNKAKLNWALANIRLIGEMQDKNEKWKVITDTVLTNIEQFNAFRKAVYQANGPVYLINGEFETEKVNRKTIDAEAMQSIKVVAGTKNKLTVTNQNSQMVSQLIEPITIGNDTVFIQTEKERWTAHAGISISRVLSELKRLRNIEPEPVPIYILDNQEITSEKLKEFKNRELEFVESLEGCDAISRYGKRAEYGVVIYRKKKLE